LTLFTKNSKISSILDQINHQCIYMLYKIQKIKVKKIKKKFLM
jgi:hypothetical protein